MLSFFRRFLRSRYGTPFTVGFLILLMAGFGLGDLLGRNNTASLKDTDVATVGSEHVTAQDLRDRVQRAIESERQRNPNVNIQQFMAEGGLEQVLEQLESGEAVQQFAEKNGLVVSKKLIDGQIASIPAFNGLDGKFDQARYEQILSQRGFTDAGVRDDIKKTILGQWVVAGAVGRPFMPREAAVAYANMMLEHRVGSAVTIPVSAMPAGPAPTDAQLQQYYTDHKLRYTVPERRVIRYALVTPEQVQAKSTPTDAELQAAYKAAKDKYAPVEKRTIRQLVVLDQAAANGIAGKIKAGTAIDKAASEAGLSAATLKDVTKAALATQTSQAIADAAFGAAKGSVIGPVKSGLGFTIAVVDTITNSPGKTFEQARAELLPQVTAKKTGDVLAQMAEQADSALSNNSTFDELMSDNKLTPAKSPALLASGANPDDPKSAPDSKLAPLLKAAFAMAADDDPAVVQAGNDGSFAVVKLDSIVAAAPRPLTAIREQVAKDYQLDQQLKAARDAANKVVKAVSAGTPLAQALATAGVKASAPQKIELDRGQAFSNAAQVPAPARMLFSMKPGQARVTDAPDRQGFVIVLCESVRAGNAASQPQAIAATQAQLGQIGAQELQEQLILAIRKEAKIARSPAAIQKLRTDLSGGGAAAE